MLSVVILIAVLLIVVEMSTVVREGMGWRRRGEE
jgi:hypothetical protein